MRKPSPTASIVAGSIVVAAAATVLARTRRTRTVVRAEDGPPHALLHEPEIEPEAVDVRTEDGARLNVLAYGDRDAPVLVFCHGWTCNAAYWTPQINAFAENYRVVVYDQRGHGDSETGARPLGADVLADDLQAVLDAVLRPGTKAILAGHSMGGMSIISWAEKYPENVHRTVAGVLLASTGTDRLVADSAIVPLPERFPRVPVPVASRLMGATLPLASSPVTTRALRYVALSPRASTAEVAFCERIVLGCPPRTRGGWGRALSALDIREGLRNLTVPTTVLVGTADRLTPPVHARRLAEELDRAGNLERLVVLDGVGHMSSVEAIDRFDEEIAHLAERAGVPVG
ncbi:alpha/beta fold hydrolase [Rhodococcus sp. CH91]|uniref:alpha/beta fold hydrolase n=1 Tax=Rhodococcus sp. CH91 TaxID=2910256 RepID=UPI001F4ADADF|nr:alpha/beta hydrolase [Rhodococcus sp. CH91]